MEAGGGRVGGSGGGKRWTRERAGEGRVQSAFVLILERGNEMEHEEHETNYIAGDHEGRERDIGVVTKSRKRI